MFHKQKYIILIAMYLQQQYQVMLDYLLNRNQIWTVNTFWQIDLIENSM